MELTPQDVRDVRFGTTRVRAGYDMSEVDAFLDRIEAAIQAYVERSRHLQDETEALRSQVQQVQSRLSSVQAELEECRAITTNAQTEGHDTIVTVLDENTDTQITAENPIVVAPTHHTLTSLRQVRDDVQRMLTEQLELVERLDLGSD